MKDWIRAGAYLLGVFLLLSGVAWLRARDETEAFPAGSSLSSQPDGARALYLWLEENGARAARLESAQTLLRTPPRALLVIQPLFPVLPTSRPAFEGVLERGGLLVVAGDSFSAENLAEQLGFGLARGSERIAQASLPLAGTGVTGAPASGRLVVPVATELRIERSPDVRPLLEGPGGEVVAASKTHRNGTVVVITSELPFSNEGLRDGDTARWVHRELVTRVLDPAQSTPTGTAPPASGNLVYFDETHRAPPGASGADEESLTRRMLRWVTATGLGGAALYGGALVFIYLLLSGGRVGPPLRPVQAGAASRTMYEHIQALGGLYRRGGQFLALRAHYARQYRRHIAIALGSAAPAVMESRLEAQELAARGLSPERAAAVVTAVAAIDAARNERQLGAAVRRAEEAVSGLRSGTLRKMSGAGVPAGVQRVAPSISSTAPS